MYGESSNAYVRDCRHRQYLLRNERVKEAKEYDHVGLKTCTGGDYTNRTLDRIKKGRKTLNPSGQMYVQCTYIVRTSPYIRIWYG